MAGSEPKKRVCLLSQIRKGHFQSYVDLIGGLLEQEGVDICVTERIGDAIAFDGPVLIPMFEQFRLAAHLVVLARAVRGRRTAAFVFRFKEALTGRKPLTRLKRTLFRVERRLPSVTIMAMLPPAVLPGSDALFRSWVHDPQVWDIPFLPEPERDEALAERVRTRANGRRVILAAGLMAEYKGMDMLAALADDSAFCARYFLVVAGTQVGGLEAKLTSARGDCLIENRYISDGELYALYDVADYVWAVYSPAYDQASGIFGRAVQFGRTPIIRAGSLLQPYSAYLGIASVPVEWNESADRIALQLEGAPGKVKPLAIGKDESAAALIGALFGDRQAPAAGRA